MLTRAPLAQAVSLVVLLMLGAQQAAQAQPQGGGAPVAISIAAQPLSQALTELARQTGTTLVAAPALLAGKQAPAVSGTLAPQQALERLLAGSGLAGSLREGVITVHRAAQEGSTGTLAEVVVKGQAETTNLTEGTGSYTTRSTNAATGLNLSLRETPQSMTVITRQRMDDQGLNELGQVLAQTPGLSVQQMGGGALTSAAYVYSRGYRINSMQVDGATVSPYTFSIDGTGYTDMTGLDTAVYDSVAILRGPSGLMTGAGDPSGTISVTRKRPTDSFQASVSGSIGRWDRYRGVADLGGPLNAAGTLRGRLVAAYEDGKSWIDRVQQDKTLAYGVLEADLSRDTLLRVSLEHSRKTGKGASTYVGFPIVFEDTKTPTPFGRSDSRQADWTRTNRESTNLSLALEHRFNDDWQFQANYGYTAQEYAIKGISFLGANSNGTFAGYYATNLLDDGFEPTKTHAHDFNARLNGRFTLGGRKHDLVVGFNGYTGKSDSYNSVAMDYSYTSIPGSGWVNWDGSYPENINWAAYAEGQHVKTEQYGFFGATRLRPTDQLSVILGGRVSTWKTRTVNTLTGATTDNRKENSVFTPYAAVVYDLSKSLSAYASYTEIFNPQNYKDVGGSMLNPEKGKNIELGLKGEWFDGRLNASAAVFETRKDNLAVRDGDRLTPDGSPAYVAESGTKGRGWELEVSGELARGWQMQGGYTRIVTKNASGTTLNTSTVPKHIFKLFTTWTPASLSQLTIGGGAYWQSKMFTSNANPVLQSLYTQKSYAVFSLMAQYRFNKHLHLAVQLNNVFDKTYRTYTTAHEYGAPRNLQATLTYKF
ncbi:MAG: TonB-dependent siderophore receptor [Acidovorax sp.]